MVRNAIFNLAIYISYYNCLIFICSKIRSKYIRKFSKNVEQNETYPSSDISVTDENAPIAQVAAMAACYNRYECINPENIEDEDLI